MVSRSMRTGDRCVELERENLKKIVRLNSRTVPGSLSRTHQQAPVRVMCASCCSLTTTSKFKVRSAFASNVLRHTRLLMGGEITLNGTLSVPPLTRIQGCILRTTDARAHLLKSRGSRLVGLLAGSSLQVICSASRKLIVCLTQKPAA